MRAVRPVVVAQGMPDEELVVASAVVHFDASSHRTGSRARRPPGDATALILILTRMMRLVWSLINSYVDKSSTEMLTDHRESD